MKNVSTLVLGATLFTISACGNNHGPSSRPKSTSMLLSEEGHYQATLAPINAHLSGNLEGSAFIKIKGDDVTVEVKVNGSTASIKHAQFIHVADSCPTLSSEENKDGVIDSKEGMKSYGPAVIPLDSELKTQVEKNVRFPSADFSGNYFYRQSVSMRAMMIDLTSKDLDNSDEIIKMKSNVGLSGRQIVIYGVASDATIPETVSQLKGQTKAASIPVACGSFIKIAVDEGTSSSGGKEE